MMDHLPSYAQETWEYLFHLYSCKKFELFGIDLNQILSLEFLEIPLEKIRIYELLQ